MNKFMSTLCFLIFGLGIFAQQPLSSTEITAFKKQVKEKAQATQTIKSNFTQQKHLSFLENDIVSTGVFYFKQPNTVKWHYLKPFDYGIIFKDGKMLINDEGKKSTVNTGNNKLFNSLNNLIANSATGDMFDETNFTITYQKTDNNYLVALRPKDKNLQKYIYEFQLYFGLKNHIVEAVKMIEPSKDYTFITFTDREENSPIKDEVFSN